MTIASITSVNKLSLANVEVLVIRLPSAQNGNTIDLSLKGLGGATILAIQEYDASTTPVLLTTNLATLSANAGAAVLTVNNSSTRTLLIWAV